MKSYDDFLVEKKVTERDILKAIKKDKSRYPGVLLLIHHQGREMHVSLNLDQFKDGKRNKWQFIGNDDDGNEIEFNIKDVSRIE